MFFIDYLKRKRLNCPEDLSEDERHIIIMLEKENEDQKWFPCYFNYDDWEAKMDELERGDEPEVIKQSVIDEISKDVMKLLKGLEDSKSIKGTTR